jgi:hypothetical protein
MVAASMRRPPPVKRFFKKTFNQLRSLIADQREALPNLQALAFVFSSSKGFGFVFGSWVFGPYPSRCRVDQPKGAAKERAPRQFLDPPPIRPASIRTFGEPLAPCLLGSVISVKRGCHLR